MSRKEPLHIYNQTLTQNRQLNAQPYTTSHTSTQTENTTLFSINDNEILIDHQPITDKQALELQDKFRPALIQYAGMDPEARPRLPKLKHSPKLFHLIYLFNQNILQNFVTPEIQITETHTLIYCTALAIILSLIIKSKTH